MVGPSPESANAPEDVVRRVDLRAEMSEDQERARVLAAVLRDQASRAEAAREAEWRRTRQTRVRRSVLVSAWLGMAYVWLGSPSWLRVTPPSPPEITNQARALRVDVFLQSQQIEAYRQERGRLPYVLSEAGPPFPGMQYHRKDSRSYELLGASGHLRLQYDSGTPPLDFVGSAADMLDGTGTSRR